MEKKLLSIGNDNIYIETVRNKENTFVFISSDGYTNPSQFILEIFEFVKNKYEINKCVFYIDLSKLFGKSSKRWFYKLIYKMKIDNEYSDDELIPIEQVIIKDKIENEVVKNYLRNILKEAS